MKTWKIVDIGLFVSAVLIISLGSGLRIQGLAGYNKLFGSKVYMAMTQPTFEGVYFALVELRTQTESTFTGFKLDETYNTPLYWGQTYSNSIQGQLDYYDELELRLQVTITEKNQILKGYKTILVPYTQWYQETLDSLRAEMGLSSSSNKLDRVLFDAWLLTFSAWTYWAPILNLCGVILATAAGLLLAGHALG